MSDFSTGKYLAVFLVCNSVISIILFSRFKIYRLLSPFVIAHVVLVSIFGLRPLVMRYPKDFAFYGLDSVSGFNEAVIAGLMGSVSLTLGFILTKPSLVAVSVLDPISRERVFTRALLLSIVLMFIWLALMFLIGGARILSLLTQGRSDQLNSNFAGIPILLQALPPSSFFILSGSLLMIGRSQQISRSKTFQLLCFFLLTAAPSALLGDRRIVLPMTFTMLVVLFQNRRNFRLGLISSLGFFVAGVILTIYPFVRSAGARQGVNLPVATYQFFQENGVVEIIHNYLVKNDTEMFNFVSYLTVQTGTGFPWGYGRGTLVDLFRESLPSSLEASHTWSDMILTNMFGGGCATGLCPVPSLVGVLFYDLGFFGVVGGFFLVGFMAKKYDGLLSASRGLIFVTALVFGSYCAVIVRGSSVAMIWIALNIIGVVHLGLLLVFRKSNIIERH